MLSSKPQAKCACTGHPGWPVYVFVMAWLLKKAPRVPLFSRSYVSFDFWLLRQKLGKLCGIHTHKSLRLTKRFRIVFVGAESHAKLHELR